MIIFFIGPDFANAGACEGRATDQLVPEEGQVFYIQGLSRNPGADNNWLYSEAVSQTW